MGLTLKMNRAATKFQTMATTCHGVASILLCDELLGTLTLMCPPLAGVVQGKFPVDQLVEHGVNIVGTAILIIQVISMLPHVNGKQWLHACCQRDIGIGGLYYLELIAIKNKPSPTTPKL